MRAFRRRNDEPPWEMIVPMGLERAGWATEPIQATSFHPTPAMRVQLDWWSSHQIHAFLDTDRRCGYIFEHLEDWDIRSGAPELIDDLGEASKVLAARVQHIFLVKVEGTMALTRRPSSHENG